MIYKLDALPVGQPAASSTEATINQLISQHVNQSEQRWTIIHKKCSTNKQKENKTRYA